ncbi:hypothetical protein predicted by Glimmer/Critica [Acetobacter senegalensis]|uniref:Uncharacterized protein n=1 Tax=Acetobacter senegalensis TaxID=446692 RepID=A0A0U5EWP0_9PROT|nr:hypothetical protein [Acetobacter senegalensis]CEF41398.1 hypothetical protein predicted by Glimmer/Critica [Acetobacter senegalensis]
MSSHNEHEIEPGSAIVVGVPKGWKPHGRTGSLLRKEKGHWMGPMLEVESGLVPLRQLDAIYEAVSRSSIRPDIYYLNWFVDCFGHLSGNISEIKKQVAENNILLAEVIDRVEELQAWKNTQLSTDIEFVRENLLLALSLPLDKAKEHIKLIYSDADQILRRLRKLVEVSLGELKKTDARRIALLEQLVTFSGYQSVILLLMDFDSKAIENITEVKDFIEKKSIELMSEWTDGVDLRAAVSNKKGLETLLFLMETIDSIQPSDRILNIFWDVPRIEDRPNITGYTSITVTGPYKSSESQISLIDATLPKIDISRTSYTFIRRGQVFYRGYNYRLQGEQVFIAEEDGYAFKEYYQDSEDYKILVVRVSRLPIQGLLHHIERLAGVVENIKNIHDRAVFSRAHPDLAHELALLCGKQSDKFEGIILRIPETPSVNSIE